MSRIITHHGSVVDLADPQPETIFLGDIIYGLSRTNRWGGHFEGSWLTVAQHSADVHDLALEIQGPVCATLPVLKAALLHDATEAYLCDIPKPIKRLLPQYAELELKLRRVIAVRFGIPEEAFEDDAVALADRIALAWEQRDNRRCGDFRVLRDHEMVPATKRVAMHPEAANAAMWVRARRLGLINAATQNPPKPVPCSYVATMGLDPNKALPGERVGISVQT